MKEGKNDKFIQLVIMLIIILIITFLVIGILSHNYFIDYNKVKTENESINNINKELSIKISENETKISELENNISELQKEKENLTSEKADAESKVQQLEKEKKDLNSKITELQKKASATTYTKSTSTVPTASINPVIGNWKNTVTDRGETYTTTFDFKSNGDFYVNGIKVGTYQDGSILFKDSNDANYRNSSYYINNGTLYIGLYQHGEDIYSSSNSYECKKN